MQAVCCLLLLAVAPCSLGARGRALYTQHRRRDPYRSALATTKGWSGSACPCGNATLCRPIQRTGPEQIYAFHVDASVNGSLEDWKHFDWSRISTLCLYGTLSPELLCHAHAHNVRISLGNGGTGYDFTEPAVDAWVKRTVHQVQTMFVDGINIDLEVSNCSGKIGNCDNPNGLSLALCLSRSLSLSLALHVALVLDTPLRLCVYVCVCARVNEMWLSPLTLGLAFASTSVSCLPNL